MLSGVILALTACFFWGLIFIVPQYMADFTPLEVVMGRFFALGMISCLLYGVERLKGAPRPSRPVWFKAAKYALFVNIFYYVALVLGVRYSDPAVVAMIAGLSPILVAFYANKKCRELENRKLILPSLLIGLGLVLVNLPHLKEAETLYEGEAYFFGLLCGVAALCFWCWFVVSNAHFLRQNKELNAELWTSTIGMCTLVWISIIACCHYFFEADPPFWEGLFRLDPEYSSFFIGGFLLGVISSWLGHRCWNRASRRLPISLAGQLLIFETVFGVIAVYLFEWEIPTWVEITGTVVMLGAIGYSTRLFYKMAKTSPSRASENSGSDL